MKPTPHLAFCVLLSLGLAVPWTAAALAGTTKDYCHAYAKKRADRKMGPKFIENAIVMGATGGLAGKAAGGKKTFTGFGLGGAAIGVIVANEKRVKVYKQIYKRCMART